MNNYTIMEKKKEYPVFLCYVFKPGIPNYTIKKINGVNYLFAEWKSGDYSNRGQKLGYCVFKKT